MNSQDFRSLQEAYMDVYNELDEGAEGGRFQYNQRHGRPLITPEVSQSRSSEETLGGGTYERGPKRLPKSKRKYDKQVLSGVRAASDQEKERARKRMGIKEDIYDIILSHLIDEGYDLSDYTWDELYEHYNQLDEVSDRKVRAVRNAREKQWNKQFGKNRVQDPTDDMVDRVDKLIDQRNKRTGSKVKKTTMGQLRDKYRKERLGEQTDLYDIILSHLIDEGYADTQEAAERIMVNMSEEWRESIVETRMDPRGRPASGPMNVYANPKGKPSQAHLDAVKSYDAEQKKKTPEQRKKELDDYRERQMNNK
jgi:hypothetical protein